MAANNSEFLGGVANYYSTKLAQYGTSAMGVDWNGEEGQFLRFRQLCQILFNVKTGEVAKNFSINDLGCGYGALFDYLKLTVQAFSYRGLDVSPAMIEALNQRLKGGTGATGELGSIPSQAADYSVASGIFNVRLTTNDADWLQHIFNTLAVLDNASLQGFAFNCLTSYSDAEKRRDYLYYADPIQLFDYCKQRFSRNVSLFHDYDLYEFTIIVRK